MKATVNGIETHYELHGREGAPWLVFSHSLACSSRMWEPQVAEFGDRYRVLVYDLRGHGASAAPAGPYSMEQLADDLKGLLDALGIRRTHFVGLSIGGAIGQTFALRHPGIFAGLVLADTNSAQSPQTLAQWEERIRIAESKGLQPLVEPTLERWFTEPFRKSRPEVVKEIGALIASTPVAGYVGCGRAIVGMNLTARLKEIKPEGDQGPGARDRRRVGRGAARHAPDTRKDPGIEAGGAARGGPYLEPGAARSVQPRSGGVPFIPAQRLSFGERTPNRSSTRATVCSTRSSIVFGLW